MFAKNNAKKVPKAERDKGEIKRRLEVAPWLPGACQELHFTAAACYLHAVQTDLIVTNLLLPSCGPGCAREAGSGSCTLTDTSETSNNLQGMRLNITRVGPGVPFRLWGAACTTYTTSAAVERQKAGVKGSHR